MHGLSLGQVWPGTCARTRAVAGSAAAPLVIARVNQQLRCRLSRRLELLYQPRRLWAVAAAVLLAAMGMASFGRVVATLSGLGSALVH
jgi:hypothetical protein